MSAVIRIDAHHHLWNLSARPQDWLDEPALEPIRRDFGPAELRAVTQRAGVDATVLVQVLPDVEETAEFLALADSFDLVAGVVGWVDLTAPDVAEQLDRLRRGPGGDRLTGVRHLVQSEPDPDWLVRPDVLAGLRAVRDAGLVYDVLTRPHQLPAALEAVRAVPDMVFVLDHLSKPDIAGQEVEPWATRLAELAAEPNVVAKVSGLVTEADWSRWTAADLRPYVDIALEAFGPDRLMVGSDWPVCLLAADYERVFATAAELLDGCSTAERDQVFGGTAARVYGVRTG
ncbi:amidohydrolase family protein [Saccharothrix sp. S26]|uniref:amidohydrolase family protein n=1 Tax=Saccharothrix sp. S26 TaxID=2907215 RepID=UPI001F35C419|nr:amidohydrolase family protein [Saccharothrix sp. S26]MCE6998563.1 amidohydrolase family protein [Saccharothrix sp. S26]